MQRRRIKTHSSLCKITDVLYLANGIAYVNTMFESLRSKFISTTGTNTHSYAVLHHL